MLGGTRRAAVAAALAALAPALGGCPSTPYPEARIALDSAPAPAPAPASASAPSSALAPVPATTTLRFSVAAMLSPQDTFSAYTELVERLGAALHARVELVQRRTYAEVNDLIAAGKVDAAMICTGGYLELQRRQPGAAELLAVPTIRGASTYRSYLIVPAGSRAQGLSDLEGKRFAFTDEISLSGRLWVVDELRRTRRDPAAFFGSVQLTGSHDRSIDAIARGVVDGACVDSVIFDRLVAQRPDLLGAVRIVARSQPFGAPPVVASTRLPPERRAELREALLALARDPAAARALRVAGFEGFVPAPPRLYDSAAAITEPLR